MACTRWPVLAVHTMHAGGSVVRAVHVHGNVFAMRNPKRENEAEFIKRANALYDVLDPIPAEIAKHERVIIAAQNRIANLRKENPDA